MITLIIMLCTNFTYVSSRVLKIDCFFEFIEASHRRCSVRKGVLINFAKFIRTPGLVSI